MNYNKFFIDLINDENCSLHMSQNTWSIHLGEHSAFEFSFFLNDKIIMHVIENHEKLKNIAPQAFSRDELKDFTIQFVEKMEYRKNENTIITHSEFVASCVEDLEAFLKTTSLKDFHTLKQDSDGFVSIPAKEGFHLINMTDFKKNVMNVNAINCYFLGKGIMINYTKLYHPERFEEFLLLKEKNLLSETSGFEKYIMNESSDSKFRAIISNYFLNNTLDTRQKARKIGKI